MRPDSGDLAYIWDMYQAAREASSFVSGATFADFSVDAKMRRAVERDLEIIGEAAHKVSKAFQTAHPEIAWRGIVAQRHVLAHEYGEIIPERIWRVATLRLPELIVALASIAGAVDE